MVVYNKSRKVITFKMKQKEKKNLFKKKFCKIPKLNVDSPFDVPSYDQILAMLNKMRHFPELTLNNGFRNSKFPSLLSFFFGVIICYLT